MKKLAAGNGAGALDDFTTTIAQDPQLADACLCRGACCLLLSNFTAAIKDFNRAKLAGDQPGTLALFQKCLDTKDDNSFGYINARFEPRELKQA